MLAYGRRYVLDIQIAHFRVVNNLMDLEYGCENDLVLVMEGRGGRDNAAVASPMLENAAMDALLFPPGCLEPVWCPQAG